MGESWRSPDLAPIPGPWFRFRPRPATNDPERASRFATDLHRALTVATELNLAFSLAWESGPRGRILFRAEPRCSQSWIAEILRPAYEPGQWIPDSGPFGGGAHPTVRWGALGGPADLPLPFLDENGPWAEPLLHGLRLLSRGAWVLWELHPQKLPRFPPAPGPRALDPPVVWGAPRAAQAPESERRRRDRTEARRHELPWAVRLTVGMDPPARPGLLESIERLVVAGTASGMGNGIRLDRPIRWIRSEAPWLPFVLSEVAGLFPTPWSPRSSEESPDEPRLGLGGSGEGSPVGIPVPRREGRHLLVLGETGMGKSSLLVRLALAASRHGGVILLDPIGDTARRFLALLPESAVDRTTFISPAQSAIGWNALAGLGSPSSGGASPADRALGDLVTALRRVRAARFPDTLYWGPRIEEVLGRTMSLAAQGRGATFETAYRLLDQMEWPAPSGPEPTRIAAREFRQWLEAHRDDVEGTRRLLGEIVRNDTLRRLLCAPDAKFSPEEAVAPGRIVVVAGDAPLVGEMTARYLLSVYLALVWSALLGRSPPRKTFVLLDELQWYAHDGLSEFLRLGRRANVHLYAATQSLRSLPEGVREALRTNAADFVVFRGDPEEAREFSRWTGAIAPERLLALPRGHAAVLLGKGSDVRWTLVRPESSPADADSRVQAIADASVARWSELPIPDLSDAPTVPRPELSAAGVLRDVLAAHGERSAAGVRRVELGWLRSAGLSIESIRQLGGDLTRAGRLLRRGRDSGGSFWDLAPDAGEN
ncbi:MAG: DUF87 domain-containing protein [Thermoplasmata archaeon]|nr:DUF87 domain-containing protein [Thermoplasmata archaeon]